MSETIRMNISITHDQRERLRVEAAKRGVSMSALIRECLRKAGVIDTDDN